MKLFVPAVLAVMVITGAVVVPESVPLTVPEPVSLALLGTGLLGLSFVLRRGRR